MAWKDTIDKWLEGLVNVSVAGDMRLKVEPTIWSLENYRNPQARIINTTAQDTQVITADHDTLIIVTNLTYTNITRPAAARFNIFTQGNVPIRGPTAVTTAINYNVDLLNGRIPLVLERTCRLSVTDTAFQAGDTGRIDIKYSEVYI